MSTKFTDIARRGGSGRSGLRPWLVGVFALAGILTFVYFAYTKSNPFDNPYRLNAIFKNANSLKPRSPVRIAGVNIGKVISVKPMENGSGMAEVVMEIEEDGLPIKRDAELKVRSRLFLEGNYFVDIHPGTPSAPELESDGWIPPNQTASPVQFGQILQALQRDTRESLKTFLKEYSDALKGPGAAGFNESIKYWEPAYRNTALATNAYLGLEPGDLQQVLSGQGRAFGALVRSETSLKGLVTNLNTTAAAFARQDDNLKATIPALLKVLRVGRPALRSLDTALPSLRSFARDALPGARSSSPTLDAQLPFIRQARKLVSPNELQGLVADLRPTVPALVRLNRLTPRSLAQSRALASCQNRVLLPFVKTPIPDPDFPENSGEPWFEQSPRVLVALAGESRLSDANSSFFRVQGGGGPTTIASTGETGDKLFGQALLPIEAVRPVVPTKRPGFRPDVPCETQEAPDLNAASSVGDAQVEPNRVATPENLAREALARKEFEELTIHMQRVAKGLPSVDPLLFSEKGEELQADRLGLDRRDDGTYAPLEPILERKADR